jgi:MerR family regulatory protein
MRRGELAELSGCNIETVRFYEKQGLLPPPPRTAGGHRDYDREHLKRLTFIAAVANSASRSTRSAACSPSSAAATGPVLRLGR